jgi:hypothetical protein
MPQAEITVEKRIEYTNVCRFSLCCIVISLAVYIGIFIGINDILWNSYRGSSCSVVNTSVVERQRCSQQQTELIFDAVWILNVQSNELHSSRYLADIRQEFNSYYKAYEAISSFNPVSIPVPYPSYRR